MTKIQGTKKAHDCRAGVMAELYGVTLEQAEAIKRGEVVEVEMEKISEQLFELGIAEVINVAAI